MSYLQYGVYLIPPPHILYPVAVAHQVLANEFNAITAGRFMVHCTIKGFFKLKEGATPQDFLPALDELFARTPAFQSEIVTLYYHEHPTSVFSPLLVLDRNEAIHKLHADVREIILPFVADDCLFTHTEPTGTGFWPHITLGMKDVPTEPGLRGQFEGLTRYIYDNLPKGPFTASDMQFMEFTSDDWTGNWGEALRFKLIKGWKLK